MLLIAACHAGLGDLGALWETPSHRLSGPQCGVGRLGRLQTRARTLDIRALCLTTKLKTTLPSLPSIPSEPVERVRWWEGSMVVASQVSQVGAGGGCRWIDHGEGFIFASHVLRWSRLCVEHLAHEGRGGLVWS